MPWCDPCERFFNPNTLTAQGCCPKCGLELGDVKSGVETKTLIEPEQRLGSDESAAGDSDAPSQKAKVPWHFKLLVAAAGGYVGWRIVQLVVQGIEVLF